MNKNFSNTSNSPLTKNAIRELFSLEIVDKKYYTVDYKLQVHNIRKNDQTNKNPNQNNIYTATLSDGEFKYTGFIIFKDSSNRVIEEGDVVRVTCVSPALLNNQKSRVFIVKKFEFCEKLAIIGNPEMWKEDLSSKERPQVPVQAPVVNRGNANMPVQINNVAPKSLTNTNTNTNINSNLNINSNSFTEVNNRPKPTANNYQINHSNISKDHMLIAHLTTFTKDIKLLFRVIKKTEMKNWSNSQNKSSGCLFSFTMIDSEGTEMPATAFNKTCEKFFNVIKLNSVYELNGGYIKMNDKKFSNIKSDYKLILDENTKIEEVEDDGSIKEQVFNYIKLGMLMEYAIGTIVDVLVVIIETTEKVNKITKLGETQLRKIIIGDDSGYKCECTLWKHYSDIEMYPGQAVSFKSVKVGEYNGKNLSSVDDTSIIVEPSSKEAADLKMFAQNFQDWKVISGSASDGTQMGNMECLYMKEVLEQLDHFSDDKIPVCKIKATICTVNHGEKNFYAGCPDSHCKKKLTQETYNWMCMTCQKPITKPTYYYTLSLRLKDSSTEHWVDIFGQQGEKLFKIPCEEYKDIVMNKDEVKLKEITNNLEFKSFYFLVKAKMQIYNQISKKKMNVYRIENVEPAQESKRLMRNLNGLLLKKF